ncbi:MAG: asparagine synthetase B [Alphaproteobacteria bacterium]|nr:asparagine synthetase B [Alphaproteobacteria bacterium]
MSAIAGLWTFGADAGPESERACEAMLAAQRAFGPDDTATLGHGGLHLGRNLFRLVPEDRFDRQPLLSAARTTALVADLRLDNREEIATALGLGAGDSRGLADAELLLAALERWDVDAIPRLLGDFAFAWFDAARQRLVLARDPLGQRPLFWHRGNGALAFASMPVGLHALDAVPRDADGDSLARYLGSLPLAGAASFYRGIHRVEPGHVVEATPGGVTGRRWWTPSPPKLRLRRFEDYVAAFRDELDAAVGRRLRGVETVVASHLSGGWDSSAVTATAARLAPATRIVALTAVPRRPQQAPPNRFADEAPLAAATAALYPNVDHIVVPHPDRSPLADMDRNRAAFDRPSFNPCNHVWLAALRDRAREAGARVLLTGEIGNWTMSASPNTLLADYLREGRWRDWLREAAAMKRARRARLRGVLASSFGPWVPDALWRLLQPFSSAPDPAEVTALHPALRAALAEEQRSLGVGAARRPNDYFAYARQAFLTEMDFGQYRKGILGGWGIDKRDATADRRLVEFCLSLPLEMLLSDGQRRPLARVALADRLPAAVLDARGKGYQAADWHEALTRDRPAIAALVDAIAADPKASSIVDLDWLRAALAAWPAGGWEDRAIIVRYRIALLMALSAGHFALSATARDR